MLGHSHIGTEHILLGLLQEGEGVAAQVLTELGISLGQIRERIVYIVDRGDTSSPNHIPFTPRGKKVLELSLREALQLGHNYIGTEHILLGLIREGEGVGVTVLRGYGLTLDIVRRQVFRHLGVEIPENPPATPEDSPDDHAPSVTEDDISTMSPDFRSFIVPTSPTTSNDYHSVLVESAKSLYKGLRETDRRLPRWKDLDERKKHKYYVAAQRCLRAAMECIRTGIDTWI